MIPQAFSSYIIGSGTLPIQCAELLLARGHRIFGVISCDAQIARWAERRNVRHIQPQADLPDILSRHSFDYLFSIANPQVLQESIVTMPDRLAINYHDALLPQYARMHATSWALMRQEAVHGITWHIMGREIGSIRALKRQAVPIGPGETACTLNAKCYQAAIDSFAVLIEELAAGSEKAQPLNMDGQSDSPLRIQPDAGGVIDWGQRAEKIDALIRALDFGPYPNPLGLAKAAIGRDFVVIPGIELLNQHSDGMPGKIVAISPDALRISTATSDVIVRKTYTIDGVPMSIPDLVSKYRLQEGDRLEAVDAPRAGRIASFHASVWRHEPFWADRLMQLTPVDLAMDHQRPRPMPPQYATASMPIPESLHKLPDSRDIVLAAFVSWAGRVSGSTSFDLGFSDAGLSSDITGLEGLFAPCVPLHIELDMEKGIREAVASIRDGIRHLRKSRTYMRDLSARWPDARPAGGLAGTARLPIVVELVPRLNDCSSTVDHAVRLVIPEEDNECWWTYDTGVLDAESIARMASQLSVMLRGIAESPECPAGKLPMLAAEETHRLLVEWNRTAADYPRETCVHELLERQAERTPEGIAVISDGHPFTYRELNQRSNQLAHHLCTLGVGPDVPVAICMERSARMLVALMGVLKAGGAYVPLDPHHPAERLAYMLADAAVPLLLTEERLLQRLPASAAQVLCLDSNWDAVAGQDVGNLSSRACPENLAYIIYTSGSTGKPKGVQIRHGAVVNFLYSMQKEPGFSAHDVMLAITTISFDIAGLELYLPLMVGGRVVIAGSETTADGIRLAELIERCGATVMQGTPATWQLLLAGGWRGNAKLKVLCGGEALSRDLAGQLLPRCAELWNLYGPTETTVWSTVAKIGSADEKISIGRPIANTEIYILDAHMQLAPAGVAGELYIGGVGLARGYLNRPELTADRFVAHPYKADPQGRLYRTGDLARYWPDGRIEHLGRMDFQVKLRGFRIELGEIETALRAHPSVREAVVTLREDRPGDRQLVAYVTAQPGHSFSAAELRTELRRKLPDYMVPAGFMLLEALPLTPNGKVDRRALPAPKGERQSGDSLVAPSNENERRIALLWQELLQIPEVGVRDSFFELGGNSLRAMEAIFRINEIFGAKLSLGAFFENPTVASLAAMLPKLGETQAAKEALSDENRLQPEWQALLDAKPQDRHEPFPLTDIQEAYWIGRQSGYEMGNVGTHAYWEAEFDGLDMRLYQKTWQRLIDRHDMLRAIVRPDGQQQILEHTPPFRIRVEDVSEMPAESVQNVVAAMRQEMSHQVLPSDTWPLFEIRALKLSDRRYRLFFSFDMLICDAWSFLVLEREFTHLYMHPEYTLPPFAVSFRDYVLALAKYRETDAYQRSVGYWESRAKDLPSRPELPLAKNPESIQKPWFRRRQDCLDRQLWDALRRKAAGHGLSENGILLAVYADVLAAWSKQPRFLINLTLFNRLPMHPQVEGLIGDFTSTTLLEIDCSANDTFLAMAKKLSGRLWNDLDHRSVSGVQVLRGLGRDHQVRMSGAAPVVFTSTLGFDNQKASPCFIAGEGEQVYAITQTPQVWLDHMVSARNGELVYFWDAVDELFPEGMVDDMFRAYTSQLRCLAQDETAWLRPRDARMDDLIPAWQLETRKAVNATVHPISDELLHVLFEQQAQRTPDATAVVNGTVRLTYAELMRHSRMLGRRLRECGAKPNSLVAIVMEKGWEQVVAALAILQSGAAYVPINANLPHERLLQLLKNSEAAIALTQPSPGNAIDWPADVRRLTVERIGEGKDEGTPLERVQGTQDLAYVIYTSGSTGAPKGVMIDHRGAVNTILDVNQRFDVGSEDRVLALSSLSFDLSVYDIFGILAAGGTIVIPDAAANRNPSHWAELIRREQVTIWNSVPALMEMLVGYVAGRSERLPDSLRLVMMSGDWIPITLPDQIRTVTHDTRLISMGGATEASIWSILYPIEHVDPAWKSIPYGRPMLNQTFHVLNELLEPCPVWVPGQLHIGGIGLAKGYWRDEEKTGAKFINHPRSGERFYCTGDLGCYLPSGDIEFLGREDFQVKIRGHRIELGEIEAALLQHPAVRTVVVVAAGESRGNKRLVAYVVPEPVPTAAREDARAAGTAAKVPSHPPGALLQDPLERLKFKLAKPGLRPDSDRSFIQLVKPAVDEACVRTYLSRRSHRNFSETLVPFERFSSFLGTLLQLDIKGAPFPKYRYGSAGGLYPVQTYLYVKPGRIEGLAPGTYYHNPASHRLSLLETQVQMDRELFPKSQTIFDECGFALFFVGQLDAISPLYGEHARDFCLIEAGLICQLLESTAADHQIGLCQIGGLDFKPIRHLFALGENHVYLHCLLGGRIDPGHLAPERFLDEFDEIRPFLELAYREGAPQPPSSLSDHVAGEAKKHESLTAETLRDFLKEKLPDYMVPASFMFLDALPLSSNGKVDRKALPAPQEVAVESAAAHVDPQTKMEQTIAGIWQEVLQVDKVGIKDNFFDLGGNSVHVVRIHSRLRQLLNMEIPIVKMFNYPTVSSLAGFLSEMQDEEDSLQQSHERADTRRALRRKRQQAKPQRSESDEGR